MFMIPFFTTMLAFAMANPIPQQILEDAQQAVSIHELANQHHELVQSHVQNLLNLGTPAIQNAVGTGTGTAITSTDGGTTTHTIITTNNPTTQIGAVQPEVQTTINLPLNQGTGTGTGTASVASTAISSGNPSASVPIGSDTQLQVKPTLEQQQIPITDAANTGTAINVNVGSSAISGSGTTQQQIEDVKPLGTPLIVAQGSSAGAGSVTTIATAAGSISAPNPAPQIEGAQVAVLPISPPIQQQGSSSIAVVSGTAITGNTDPVPAIPIASPTPQIEGVILSGSINQGSGTGSGSVTAIAAVVGDLSAPSPTSQIEDAQIAAKPLSPPFQQEVGSSTDSAGAGLTVNTGVPVIAAASPTSQNEGGIISGPTLINQSTGTGSITATAVVAGDISASSSVPQIEDGQVAIKPEIDLPNKQQEGTVSVNKVDASSSIPVANPTPQIESVKPVTPSIIQTSITDTGSVTATAAVVGDLSAPNSTPQIEATQIAVKPISSSPKEQGSENDAGVIAVNAGASSQSVVDTVPQIEVKPANTDSGTSSVPIQISGASLHQQGLDTTQTLISSSSSTGAGTTNVGDGGFSVSSAGSSSDTGSSSSKGSSTATASESAQTGQLITGVVASSSGSAKKGK